MKRSMIYILIYILNFFDLAVTVYWTNIYGILNEINPVMRMALREPWIFFTVKLILFPLFLLYLYFKKRDDTAYIALGMFLAVAWMNICTVWGLT